VFQIRGLALEGEDPCLVAIGWLLFA
jgi:hypothetical protein